MAAVSYTHLDVYKRQFLMLPLRNCGRWEKKKCSRCVRKRALFLSLIHILREGESCDLLERLAAEPAFQLNGQDLEELLKPEDYIGRCPEQVDAFVEKVIPLFKNLKQEKTEINV